MSLAAIDLAALAHDWPRWARPKQRPPETLWRSFGFVTGRAFGKHLAVDTLVPVPISSTAKQVRPGWTTMGDLCVGDTVYDEGGRHTRVTGAFDVETPVVCYRMHFSDGTHLDASSTHQWVTWTHVDRKALLRSPYDDHDRFPADWPAWRRKRIRGNGQLGADLVERGVTMRAGGMTERDVERSLGVNRRTLRRYVQAGGFVARTAKVYDDSQGPRVRTTQEIVDTLTHGARGDTNHAIPVCGAIVGERAARSAPDLSLEDAIRSALAEVDELDSDALLTAVVGRLGHGKGGFLGCIRRLVERGVIASRGNRGHRVFRLIEWEERKEIDPYVLGAWLGDGSSACSDITIGDDDVEAMRVILGAAGANLGPRRGDGSTTYPLGTGWLTRELRRFSLLGNKHVPPEMLRAPAADRLALLQGLMDTDGTISKFGKSAHVEFCSTSQPLADAVVELARSLGQKPVLRESRAKLYGRDVSAKFRVTWRPTIQVFRLPRKAARCKPGGAQGLRNHHRMIERVERIPSVPMRCIAVDSPHRMYLAGEGMIPTHNTRALSSFVVQEVMAGRAREIAFAAQNLDETERIMIHGPSGLLATSPPWFHATVIKGIVTWPNGARAIPMTPEVPGAPRGGDRDLVWLSEVAAWSAATREEFFSNMDLSLRRGLGRMVFDTTPRARNPVVRKLLERAARDPARHIVIRGGSRENADNLTVGVIAEWEAGLGQTQKGREELDGVFYDDEEGALFKQAWIDAHRREMPTALKRRIISVDPAISTGKGSDATGIVDMGLGIDDQVYVIGDHTEKLAAEVWAAKTIELYVRGGCDCVVVETNRGAELVVANIKASGERRGIRVEKVARDAVTRRVAGTVYVKEIHARGSKGTRAEPVATLAEAGRVSFVDGIDLDELENCLTTWIPGQSGESPNALDAMVHGAYELAGLSRETKPDGKAAISGAAKLQAAINNAPARPAVDIAALLGGGSRGRGGADRI